MYLVLHAYSRILQHSFSMQLLWDKFNEIVRHTIWNIILRHISVFSPAPADINNPVLMWLADGRKVSSRQVPNGA